MHSGSALIRAHLHLDPDTLTDAQWIHQVRMALWVEHRSVLNLAKMIAGR